MQAMCERRAVQSTTCRVGSLTHRAIDCVRIMVCTWRPKASRWWSAWRVWSSWERIQALMPYRPLRIAEL